MVKQMENLTVRELMEKAETARKMISDLARFPHDHGVVEVPEEYQLELSKFLLWTATFMDDSIYNTKIFS